MSTGIGRNAGAGDWLKKVKSITENAPGPWDQLLIAGSDLQYRILLNLWNQCKCGNWEHIEYGFSHQYFQRPGFSTDPTNQMPRI